MSDGYLVRISCVSDAYLVLAARLRVASPARFPAHQRDIAVTAAVLSGAAGSVLAGLLVPAIVTQPSQLQLAFVWQARAHRHVSSDISRSSSSRRQRQAAAAAAAAGRHAAAAALSILDAQLMCSRCSTVLARKKTKKQNGYAGALLGLAYGAGRLPGSRRAGAPAVGGRAATAGACAPQGDCSGISVAAIAQRWQCNSTAIALQ